MIYHGDCIEVMAQMAENSVDAIVTDPPYGLEFMGKEWDSLNGAGFHAPKDEGRTFSNMQAWHEAWAREAFRVAKPGAYLLAFGGTRTVHRLASAIEDAGWEIRDELVWVYASGFPKSLDVSKALDKAAGAEREVVGRREDGAANGSVVGLGSKPAMDREFDVTAPATDLAKQWEGWGTALKPAHEPIVMARKPLVGSVAANVTRYGTGALNIGATRIPGQWTTWRRSDGTINPSAGFGDEYVGGETRPEDVRNPEHAAGRWPSNLLLSDPELFDVANPGVVGSGATSVSRQYPTGPVGSQGGYVFEPSGTTIHDAYTGGGYEDSGGYSRFFIVPKADRADREPVLRGQLERGESAVAAGPLPGMPRQDGSMRGPVQRENAHPTVKPTDLMRHLVRLVTPPGGTVLDCFLGSGSTAIACELEGFPWIGIEKEAEYVAIAEARLNGTQRGLGI